MRAGEARAIVDTLLTTADETGLLDGDGLEAECFAAGTISFFRGEDDIDLEETFVREVLPGLERTRTSEALAVILALGAHLPHSEAVACRASALRLLAAGVAAPDWAEEVSAPLIGESFQLRYDTAGTMAALVGVFTRGGHQRAAVVLADPDECGEAMEITAMPAALLPTVLPASDTVLRAVDLTPEEFRWQAENALAMRDDHDEDDAEILGSWTEPDDDELEYLASATLLRHWLQALPVPTKRPEPHPSHDDGEDEGTDVGDGLGGGGLAGAPGPVSWTRYVTWR